MPSVQHFVRAEMLPSGYLIRPCEGGGSVIHIVDHMDLEVHQCHLLHTEEFFLMLYDESSYLTLLVLMNQPWRVPEVLRPLYESSTLLAQRTTMAVRFLSQLTAVSTL